MDSSPKIRRRLVRLSHHARRLERRLHPPRPRIAPRPRCDANASSARTKRTPLTDDDRLSHPTHARDARRRRATRESRATLDESAVDVRARRSATSSDARCETTNETNARCARERVGGGGMDKDRHLASYACTTRGYDGRRARWATMKRNEMNLITTRDGISNGLSGGDARALDRRRRRICYMAKKSLHECGNPSEP